MQKLKVRQSSGSPPVKTFALRGMHWPGLVFVGQAHAPEGHGVGVSSFGPLGQANWSQTVVPAWLPDSQSQTVTSLMPPHAIGFAPGLAVPGLTLRLHAPNSGIDGTSQLQVIGGYECSGGDSECTNKSVVIGGLFGGATLNLGEGVPRTVSIVLPSSSTKIRPAPVRVITLFGHMGVPHTVETSMVWPFVCDSQAQEKSLFASKTRVVCKGRFLGVTTEHFPSPERSGGAQVFFDATALVVLEEVVSGGSSGNSSMVMFGATQASI
jgi:hypothetical protein